MSVVTFDPNAPVISVTDKAARHFISKLQSQGGKLVRLSIKNSGCTGFAYVLDTVESAEPGDHLVQVSPELQVAVSPEAVPVIRGTEIDMAIEGVNRVIKYHNPNVVAECGCGESFSVQE